MSPYDRDRYDPRPRYNDDYGLLLCNSLSPALVDNHSTQILIPEATATHPHHDVGILQLTHLRVALPRTHILSTTLRL